MAHSSLRFGIGRFTTEAEIDYVVEKIAATVQRLRDMRYSIHERLPIRLLMICYYIVRYGKWYKRASTYALLIGLSIK